MNVDGDQSQRILGVDGHVEEGPVVGEDAKRKRKSRIEAGKDAAVVLLVWSVNLFDDHHAQFHLVHQVPGGHGHPDGIGKVHLHQTLRDALSSGNDVVGAVFLVVGAQVVLEVDQGLAIGGQPRSEDVKIIARQGEELSVG